MDPAVIPSQLRDRPFVKIGNGKKAFESFDVKSKQYVYDFEDPDLIDAIEAQPIGHRRRMIAEQLGEIVVQGGRLPIQERVAMTWRDGSVYEYEPPLTPEQLQDALEAA